MIQFKNWCWDQWTWDEIVVQQGLACWMNLKEHISSIAAKVHKYWKHVSILHDSILPKIPGNNQLSPTTGRQTFQPKRPQVFCRKTIALRDSSSFVVWNEQTKQRSDDSWVFHSLPVIGEFVATRLKKIYEQVQLDHFSMVPGKKRKRFKQPPR